MSLSLFLFRACVTNYMFSIGTAARALGLTRTQGPRRQSMGGSLDHSIFYYSNDFDCTEWLLLVVFSVFFHASLLTHLETFHADDITSGWQWSGACHGASEILNAVLYCLDMLSALTDLHTVGNVSCNHHPRRCCTRRPQICEGRARGREG